MLKTALVILVFSSGDGQTSTDAMIKFEGDYAYEDCIAAKTAILSKGITTSWLGAGRYVDKNIICIPVDTSHRN